MGGKPRIKPTEPKKSVELTKEELKSLVGEMAGLLIWCLKFTKFPDGMMWDEESESLRCPQSSIFDALDKMGRKFDRDKYFSTK